MVSLVFLKGAVLVPGLEAGEEDATFDATLAAMCGLAPWCRTLVWLAPNGFQDFFAPRLAGNAGFLVGKKCYQVGFYEGQRKGCGRHKVIGSSKALLLLSVPQVILALWCLAAAISGIFVVLSAQAAASGACWHPLFQVPLLCSSRAGHVDRFSGSLLRLFLRIWDPGGSCVCLHPRVCGSHIPCCSRMAICGKSLCFSAARACSGTSDRFDRTHC